MKSLRRTETTARERARSQLEESKTCNHLNRFETSEVTVPHRWIDEPADLLELRSGNTPGGHQASDQHESWWNHNGHNGDQTSTRLLDRDRIIRCMHQIVTGKSAVIEENLSCVRGFRRRNLNRVVTKRSLHPRKCHGRRSYCLICRLVGAERSPTSATYRLNCRN